MVEVDDSGAWTSLPVSRSRHLDAMDADVCFLHLNPPARLQRIDEKLCNLGNALQGVWFSIG